MKQKCIGYEQEKRQKSTWKAWMRENLEGFSQILSLTKNPSTKTEYVRDVGTFLDYLVQRDIKRITSIKPKVFMDYLQHRQKEGRKNSSITRYFMSIRSFATYLRKIKAIKEDFTEDIPLPQNVLRTPKIPSLEEIKLLLALPDQDNESGMRDKAMMELLYSSGLRASEICNLELGDLTDHKILIKCGKRSKPRAIPITDDAFLAINKYIDDYRGKERGYLFLTQGGKKINRQFLSKTIRNYARKLGLQELTTHTLRHACATHLLDQGADLRLIQEILGHSSISSTQRYTHLSGFKMKEMFNKFHPRGKNGKE
jgi:integrase/recombinase XerD